MNVNLHSDVMTKKDLREVNHQIYLFVCHYLLGNKHKGNYIIDSSYKGTRARVIRVCGGWNLPTCYIYFDYDIRIGILWHNQFNRDFDEFYTYYGDNVTYPLSIDIDDYIYVTKNFLYELIRHVMSVKWLPESYPNMHRNENGYIDGGATAGFQNCSVKFQSYCDTHEHLLRYHYSYEDRDLIEYVTSVMKSKAFKRSRGDCK